LQVEAEGSLLFFEPPPLIRRKPQSSLRCINPETQSLDAPRLGHYVGANDRWRLPWDGSTIIRERPVPPWIKHSYLVDTVDRLDVDKRADARMDA
jgi:hypothetical protein